MRAVIQRVKKSSVEVNGKVVGEISKGYNILLGVETQDTDDDLNYIANKVLNLRIFEDEDGKMNLSIIDIKGEILLISQFTLLADCRKGRRPSFSNAEKPEIANKFYEKLADILSSECKVERGVFREDMLVKIENDGPVTVILDSKKRI